MIPSYQLWVPWQLQAKCFEKHTGSLLQTRVWFASVLVFPYSGFEICHANFQALKQLILLGLKEQASISEPGGGAL